MGQGRSGGPEGLDPANQFAPLPPTTTGVHPVHDSLVEGAHPDRVPLAQEDEGHGGSQRLRVPELGGQHTGAGTPVHGRAHVQEQVGPQVRLLFELLHEEAVGPAVHAPVDVPEVVSRLVVPQLGELRGEAPVRGAVEPHEETLHHLPGDEFDPAQGRQGPGVQEVGSGSDFGACHGPEKLADSPGAGHRGPCPPIATGTVPCQGRHRFPQAGKWHPVWPLTLARSLLPIPAAEACG